ncbi:MAG: hypothetical protein ACSHW0_16045 [Thalassotalea sp.]
MKSKKLLLISSISLLLAAAPVFAGENTVGSSLNKKFSLPLAQIPAQAMATVLKARKGFVAKEAEKELKHGNEYIDIEGIDANGQEIEFDMLMIDGVWTIVEIQRDLELSQCPTKVVAALSAIKPAITAKRIIESEQSDGVVIYEFYTVDGDGSEKKYEVKYNNDVAELLTKEWRH